MSHKGTMCPAGNRREDCDDILFCHPRVELADVIPIQCGNDMRAKFSLLKKNPIECRIPFHQFIQDRANRRSRHRHFLRPCKLSQVGVQLYSGHLSASTILLIRNP